LIVKRETFFNEVATLVMPSVLSKPAALRGTLTSSEIGPEHLILILMKMLLLAILSKFQSYSKTTQKSLCLMIKAATSDLKHDFKFFLQNCKNRVLLDSLARFVGKSTMSFENVFDALTQVFIAYQLVFGIQIASIIECQTLQNALFNLFQTNNSFKILFWNKVWKSHFETELQYISHKQNFLLASPKPLKVSFSDVENVKTFSAFEEQPFEDDEVPHDEVTQLVSAIVSADQSIANLSAVVSSAIAFGEGNQSLTSGINGSTLDAAELVNASALGATSDAFAEIKAAFEALEVDLAVSAAAQAGESLFRSDAQSSEPSLGSLAKSLERLELTPLVSSFDIPVETDATLFASSKTLSFEDVPALPLPDGERRALSPLHSVEDRVPGAHPPLPRKFSPLGGDIGVVGAQSSGNPSGNPSKVALSHVGVGGNPRTNQPSFPPQGDIEGHPVQVLASSGNPPGNSGGVDRPKSHSCSKLASDSSQVGLPSTLGFPGSKDGKPVRPPPLAPVVSSSKGTSIHGSPPVSYSPGNQSGSASTSKAPKELQGKPLPPMLQNWKFSPIITCRSPTSSAAVYSRPLGQDIGDSPGHSSSDPPGSVSYSAPPLSNSARECCDPRVSAAFYSRPLGQDIGGTKRTPMLNDWGWVLFAAACLPATSSPISASPPLWVPMNLGTRSVRSA
jgi:hypothetical protein